MPPDGQFVDVYKRQILIRSNGKVTQKFLGYALKAHQWEVLQLSLIHILLQVLDVFATQKARRLSTTTASLHSIIPAANYADNRVQIGRAHV